MAGKTKEPGPSARRVAASINRIRRGLKVTTAQLSRRLDALGQPIPDTSITKTEQGTRRVDVDDLAALALALGVTPNTLLLPQVDYLGVPARHQITPQAGGTASELWRWAQGEMPLPVAVPGSESWLGGGEFPMQEFAVRNRPYLTAPRPPAADSSEADAALGDLASAVVAAMRAGAPATEVRRAVELTIALPVILVTPEFRSRLSRDGGQS